VSSIVRRGRPDEVQALGELSDRVFRPYLKPGSAMPREFPRLFHPDNAANLYFVADAHDRPISLVGTYKTELIAGGARLSAISIGSVATMEEHRGQGYASQILRQVMADARPHHALMLVSGGRDLYRRLGCVSFGLRMRATLTAKSSSSDEAFIREVTDFDRDAEALGAVYRGEPYRALRTPEEMASFLEATRTPSYRARSAPAKIYAAETADGIVAYAVATLARDGSQVDLVEWAGDRTKLLSLAEAAALGLGGETVSWTFQPDDYSMRALVTDQAHLSYEPTTHAGTLRIVNLRRLLNEVNPLLKERTGHVLEVLFEDQERAELAWSGIASQPTPKFPVGQEISHWSRWFFSPDGLNLPLPDTDGLNFV
jgi:GNAT superfamily N-acetyltransferase